MLEFGRTEQQIIYISAASSQEKPRRHQPSGGRATAECIIRTASGAATGPGMSRTLTAYLRRRARDLSRFRRARGGATAVEFAFIFPIFLAVLIALLQTTFFLFAQSALQTAATEAGRLFMTGQGPAPGTLASSSSICPIISPLLNCNSVMVDVQSYPSFIGANASMPTLTYNSQGAVTNNWSYNGGTPGDVVVVRLIYQWSVVGNSIFAFANLPNSMREMMGVAAVRVEPSY
jgi:Flp pilus assembly protein TadG